MIGRYYKLPEKPVADFIQGDPVAESQLRILLRDKIESEVDRDSRCMVCGSTRASRMVRVASREVGEESQWGDRVVMQVRYCADDARCGEGAAESLLDLFEAPFKARKGAE